MDPFEKDILDRCAWVAVCARGYVEPNPLVGCAITAPDGRVLGMGHHEKLGGAHAEINALRACRANGESVSGATAWVTLEPCRRHGRTPPCTDALIEAGIARVVYSRRDPSGGGQGVLREAGIEVRMSEASRAAIALSDPFVMRAARGRAWVTVKWAQSIDGKVATRSGDSQWISNACSRRVVHRMRGRADVILTGVGTVLADDPLLTARDVRVRRNAKRVVVDPGLETAVGSALAASASDGSVVLVVDPASLEGSGRGRADALERLGVQIRCASMVDGRIDLRAMMCSLSEWFDATNVLVEAGAGLIGALHGQDLIDELVVFTAPFVLGDTEAMDPVRGTGVLKIAHPERMELWNVKRIGDDVLTRYRRSRLAGEP